MTSAKVAPIVAPAEAVPIIVPVSAPKHEPITISKPSAEELAPEVSPSATRVEREVVRETVPARSITHRPAIGRALYQPNRCPSYTKGEHSDTLSRRHVNFMNDYSAVCYQLLPMMVEVKEMEQLEAERAKFVVKKAEQEARTAELEAQRAELQKLLEASVVE
ncbi:uncharacterized protein LOC131227139 [Magnolia sinica]|uniref:uncharacterized protein LOC131227139 n=1 Tax=Magnolia sinica TaxID=86752 RepID=UPI0026584063|nr:uncharacterized protein LOC131227139 [Magnolia sinica]